METPKTIKLRGHHLKLLSYLVFPQYYIHTRSDGVQVTQERLALTIESQHIKFLESILKNEEQKIMLVKNIPDQICDNCTSFTEEFRKTACFDDTSIDKRRTDTYVAKSLGLETGKVYFVKEIKYAIQQNKSLVDSWR